MLKTVLAASLITITSMSSWAASSNVDDSVINKQRESLALSSQGKGIGPQSPRDIDHLDGQNKRVFSLAPQATHMSLCNIHFHIVGPLDTNLFFFLLHRGMDGIHNPYFCINLRNTRQCFL